LFISAKGRRQPKAVKPKKMIRLESKNIVYAACNNGSSAVLTKDGALYMFGKDTSHCHQSNGTLTFYNFKIFFFALLVTGWSKYQ